MVTHTDYVSSMPHMSLVFGSKNMCLQTTCSRLRVKKWFSNDFILRTPLRTPVTRKRLEKADSKASINLMKPQIVLEKDQPDNVQ